MTLIEDTYQTLKKAKLTTTREAFSSDYICRSRNWFAWQRHVGRDFSIAAAVQCLRSIRLRRQRVSALNIVQLQALATAEQGLREHLIERYSVADVCG